VYIKQDDNKEIYVREISMFDQLT